MLMRRAVPTVAIALVLASAVLQIPAAAMEKPGQPGAVAGIALPSGLVVVLTTKDLNEPSWHQALNNPSINGVALQIHWSDLEPVKDKPDWSKLDDLFSAAVSSNKWVQLLVFPGFFTPTWALKGVQTDTFPIQYGPGKGTVETLPMPWDSTYLANWFGFVERLSDRYGKSTAFRMIGAAGPTSVSVETTLPMNFKKWQADGYTPSKYTGAWKQALTAYNTDFPNQYVSLSLGSGLGINDMGKRDESERASTMQTIVDQAIKTLGRRCALQYSNLDGTSNPPQLDFTLLIGYNGSYVTGLQMRTSASNEGMGAPGTAPSVVLQQAIDKGLQPNAAGQHVTYLEIYERDVLDDSMQSVLSNGALLFAPKPPVRPVFPTPRY